MSRNPDRQTTFHFKQFDVLNCKSAMKVSTDGVLLGAWTDLKGKKHILDIGTGTGVIALMVAQRNHDAIITAIEIDKIAADEAQYNVNNSPWSDRIEIINGDFHDFYSGDKFDLIISNPPFFNNGIKAPDHSRATARHCDTLDYSDILSRAGDILTDSGSIALVAPYDRLCDILHNASSNGLYATRITAVSGKPCKAPNRVLISLTVRPTSPISDSLIIRDENDSYTQEYIELTKDFYLKF